MAPLHPDLMKERPFLAKLGSAFTGFWVGIGGMVAYPIIETISNGARDMRHYKASDSFPLKFIKGTRGLVKGATIGFGKGLLKGFAAPFALSRLGWKGKLDGKLRSVRDDFIDDVRGRPRRRFAKIEMSESDYHYQEAYNHTSSLSNRADDDPYELDFNTLARPHKQQPAHKPRVSVLHAFPAATTISNSSDATTLPITMTLTSNDPITSGLTKKKIANISKKLTSGNNTFALLENHLSFVGSDPAAALIECQKLRFFQKLQKTATYELTITDTEEDLEKVCEYLKTCHTKGIKITKFQMGKKHYIVPASDIRAETLVLSSPKKKLENS